MAAQNASDAIATVPFSPASGLGSTASGLGSTAQSCMSSPVRTVLSTQTISDAQGQLLRYGHTALCVIDESAALIGVISRRDTAIAIRHGLGHRPVFTCMGAPVKTIAPTTSLADIQSLMVVYGLGRFPVVCGDALVGIVTRSDVLRQLSVTQASLSAGRTISEQGLQPVPSPQVLYTQLKARIAAIWPALMLIAQAATEKGWTVYLVGGAVRDLLLNCLGQSYPLTDIDLVVAGAESGAGATLAEIIEASYPQVTAQVYGTFQTATLTWPTAASGHLSEFSIDIATARTEFYAYPAANPDVEVSTIHQDLYRRDFTVNAIALRLEAACLAPERLVPECLAPERSDTNPVDNDDSSHTSPAGLLLDFFGGWTDLQRGHIRAIHPNSFIEDPTRIFRAVRFSVRLGFVIEPRTEQLIRYAVESGAYAKLQASGLKIPALQSRLTTELEYVLSSDRWATGLAELDRLGALACIHCDMAMSPELWRQLRRMARWQPKFAPDQPCWLLLLSLLIASLLPSSEDASSAAAVPPSAAAVPYCVASTLNLGQPSEQRLKKLHQWEADLCQQLPLAHRPSQVFKYLQPYGQFELLLIAARHPYTLGPHIWHYVVHLSRMSPLINGATLKRLGYRPGPQFREILAAVHQHTLDGDLHTPQSAEDYVIKTYPRDDD